MSVNNFWIGIFLWVCCFAIWLSSCASSGQLGGGPRDVAPPVLDTLHSDTNFQTNVKKSVFTFRFNEYIQVKDVVKQVLVSPPLIYIPKLKARGKVIEFSFNEKETLKQNTTYIVNFGESIMDFTESNKLKNFKLVFSTGDAIDSLELKGKVVDENNKPIKDITVMLYDTLNDSIVLNKKPYYYTKTNESGEYAFQNLKNDTFKIIGLKDENSNLLYDELTESIGFIEKSISWDTSTIINQNISVSKAEIPFKIRDKIAVYKGKLALKLASKLDYIPDFKIEPHINANFTEISNDSLIIWYKELSSDTFNFIFDNDTTVIKIPKNQKSITTLSSNYQINTNAYIPSDTMSITFSQPIEFVNDSFILFTDTSNVNQKYTYIIKDKTLKITSALKSKELYKFSLLPKAVFDIFGNTNDTLNFNLKTIDIEKLSSLNLEIISLDSSIQYIIQLMQGNTIIKSDIIRGLVDKKLSYTNLRSDEYSINIIEDTNRNGRKDLSNYWLKRKPEISKSVKLEKLRENWVLDQELDYTTMNIPSNTTNEPAAQSNRSNTNNRSSQSNTRGKQ